VAPLSRRLGRVVLDRTNLTGVFDLDLQWTNVGGRNHPGAAPLNESPSSLFGVLEEELGLALQPETAPVEVLVIEHAEHPARD
jgi:uncharacterized protein (TIGR03435 family)